MEIMKDKMATIQRKKEQTDSNANSWARSLIKRKTTLKHQHQPYRNIVKGKLQDTAMRSYIHGVSNKLQVGNHLNLIYAHI